jgi:hypothetical protein
MCSKTGRTGCGRPRRPLNIIHSTCSPREPVYKRWYPLFRHVYPHAITDRIHASHAAFFPFVFPTVEALLR